MKTRPILFTGPMVRAILNGTKTTTRRPVKWKPLHGALEPGAYSRLTAKGVEAGFYCTDVPASGWTLYKRRNGDGVWNQLAFPLHCPYGKVGDRLWVRETFALETWTREFGDEPPLPPGKPYREYHDDDEGEVWEWPHYRATDPAPELAYDDRDEPGCRWQPSIFMPRWISRITLEIVKVSLERLSAITAEDALAEGVVEWRSSLTPRQIERDPDAAGYFSSPEFCFEKLWDSIHGKSIFRAASDPWVWKIDFKRVCNFDPRTLAGQPIGMTHCPECGEMILAGEPHPDYSLVESAHAE